MRPRRGFTLVELLVVIAILGILAGFVAAGLPRVLRQAKMKDTMNTMNQIRTALVAYYTDHNSLPPSYGYISPVFLRDPDYSDPQQRPQLLANSGLPENRIFFLVPWMTALREHGNESLYDRWSRGNGFDTDGDNVLSRLEYAPIGQYDGGSQSYTFGFTELYLGNNGSNNSDPLLLADLDDPIQNDGQLNVRGPRPLIYVGVNDRQVRQFRSIMYDFAERLGNVNNPRPLNLDAQALAAIRTQLSFPPPSYDAFVLISVGPNFLTGTNGIIVDADAMGLEVGTNVYDTVNQYHLVGLATYFLATRDFEAGGKGDGELDFDFTARTRGQGENRDNDMPGSAPLGDGPIIYTGNL